MLFFRRLHVIVLGMSVLQMPEHKPTVFWYRIIYIKFLEVFRRLRAQTLDDILVF